MDAVPEELTAALRGEEATTIDFVSLAKLTYCLTHNYTIVIEPASAEDGGGFLAFVPDLPGCMSDGETYEQAARNVAGAIES